MQTPENSPRNPTAGAPGVGAHVWLWGLLLAAALLALPYFHFQPQLPYWLKLTPAPAYQSQLFALCTALAMLAAWRLLSAIHRRAHRLSAQYLHRAEQAEDAIERLRAEIRVACFDAPGEVENSYPPALGSLTKWQAGNQSHSAELARLSGEISTLSEAIGRVNETASQAASRAQHFGDTARDGAAAAQNNIAAMHALRGRIEAAAARLQALAGDAKNFQRTVQRIADVTEQSGVLALNATLRGDGGEQNEEMRRLADRAARAAEENAAQSRAVQSAAETLVRELQSIGVGDDAQMGEVARALAEIERASGELLGWLQQTAAGAAAEAGNAQSIGAKMQRLKTQAEQSGAKAFRIIAGLEKLKGAARAEDEEGGPVVAGEAGVAEAGVVAVAAVPVPVVKVSRVDAGGAA